jgi:hypothetical protein
MLTNRVAQRLQARQGRVLILPTAERLHCRFDRRRWTVAVREAMPEVDRTGPGGERRHLGEDRRSKALQSRNSSHAPASSPRGHAQ